MSSSSPSPVRSDLLASASEQVTRHEADALSGAALGAWLANATQGRPGMLMALSAEIEARRERGECTGPGWSLLLSHAEDLMDDQTSTEPGVPGDPPAPPRLETMRTAPPDESTLRTAGAGRAHDSPATPRQTPSPARVADRFQLLESVREGACSRVYRALDTRAAADSPDRFVALRLVPADQPPRVPGAERNALSALSRHPNLATLVAWGDSEGWSYQAMTWIDGVTLDHLLAERSNVPGVLADAPDWIVEIAAALDVLHAEDFVHGDIAPANIMITYEGHAVLIDLNGVRTGALRVAGGAGLTRAFASPEALTGAPADPRDDVYGLAAVAFRLLAGHLPHGRDGSSADGHPLPPPARPSGLTDAQWQALSAALDPARERRPAGAGAFARALRGRERIAGAHGARRGRRTGRLALLGTSALLLAGWALLPNYAPLLPVAAPDWLMPPWGAATVSRDPVQAVSVDEELAGRPATVAADEPAEADDGRAAGDSPLSPVTPRVSRTPPVDLTTTDLPDMPVALDPDTQAIVAGEIEQPTPALEPVTVTVTARNITIPPAPVRYAFSTDELRIAPGDAAAMLPVTRSGPLDESADVPFVLLPGSAMPDEDFAWPGSPVARFASGEARALIVIPLIHGTEPRPERWFLVRLEPDDADALRRVGEVVVTLPAVR